MKYLFTWLLALSIGMPTLVCGQFRLIGRVADSQDQQSLAYVNIGIKQKNIGTVTSPDGSFWLDIPSQNRHDTLTFSLVGYQEYSIALEGLPSEKPLLVHLLRKNTVLSEVTVVGQQWEERRFGIKRRSPLIHFIDGMFNEDDSFEIGQLIKLGVGPVKLTGLNLFIVNTRQDSATFRVNFYRYRNSQPAERLVEKEIIQRKAIKKGWLRFDLRDDNIRLSGDVVAAVEFLPEHQEDLPRISYEIKLGGSSRSFYRRSSLGTWNTPPHHYCLHVTALVSKGTPESLDEDIESTPAFTFLSHAVGDSFSVFVALPKNYGQDTTIRYPVLYHLDGNAYFDEIKNAVNSYSQGKGRSITPIVVGIGYENAYLMDSLRVRDYTYPPASPIDSFTTSGGADRFYTFLKEELIPYIDRSYTTDTTSRTLMGHSFGGYFVLYALLRDEGAMSRLRPQINNYVSASPSIGYRGGYIVEQWAQRLKIAGPATKRRQKLYLSIGQRELTGSTQKLFDRLAGILQAQKDVFCKIKLYPDIDHMGTAVPSFEDAIRLIYE